MGLKDWLGFKEEEEEVNIDGYLENLGLHNGELLDEDKYKYVKSFTANHPDIINEVGAEVKKGNIILLDTGPLNHNNPDSLKELISSLKDLEGDIDGDMGRVSDTKILIVPSEYRILKRVAD